MPNQEIAMSVDRFAAVELRIDKEQPSAVDLNTLLGDWGLTDSSQERLWVISYDGIQQVRTVTEVAVGGYHSLDVPLPPLLTAVLLAGTDRFLVAHNHPTSDISPTMHDVDMVHTIMAAANAAGLYFEDSLIVGPGTDTMFSFAEHGLLIPAPELKEMAEGGHRRPFTR